MGLLKDIKTQLKILESVNEGLSTSKVKRIKKKIESDKDFQKYFRDTGEDYDQALEMWLEDEGYSIGIESAEEAEELADAISQLPESVNEGKKSGKVSFVDVEKGTIDVKFPNGKTKTYKAKDVDIYGGADDDIVELGDKVVVKESVNEGLSTSDQQKVEKMFYAAKDKLGSRYNWKTHLTPIYHAISKKLKLNIDDVSGHLNLVGESVNECGECEEELEEASTTGGVAGYDTPNVFGDKSPASKKKRKKYSTSSTGYKMVKEASMYKRMISQMYKLNETSYRDYKKDPTSTPAQKVNRSIQEVNRMLGEIDKTVSHNLKLKLEAGVDASHFWKSTSRRFGKIGERLVKISNRIKELSQ